MAYIVREESDARDENRAIDLLPNLTALEGGYAPGQPYYMGGVNNGKGLGESVMDYYFTPILTVTHR